VSSLCSKFAPKLIFISDFAEGLVDVLVYTNPDDPSKKNRGFAFLDYDTHKNASAAKRKMDGGQVAAWGRQFVVSWAEPQEEPDAETMAKVCCVLLCVHHHQ